jgi:hypothetical protein
MTTARDTKYALAYGALPALNSSAADPGFQTPYWVAVAQYLKDDGVPAPALVEYDKGTTLLADTLTKLITDPKQDIMANLKASQDEYNASIR